MSEVHTRSKIGHGSGGKNTPIQSESKKISSSKSSLENTDTSSSTRLPWLSGKQGFREQLINDWLQAQSKILCSMYARPFEKMGTQTHPLTTMGCLHSFFSYTDPEEKHQKAIPISVIISELIRQDSTELERATGKLATVGIFFVMRSCKYLKVAKPNQQRIEILRQRNEQLSHDHRELELIQTEPVQQVAPSTYCRLHISYSLYILHNLLSLSDDELEAPGAELISVRLPLASS